MIQKIFRAFSNMTPEKTQAWTLALYPALTAIGVGFLLVTKAEITPEIVGLFIGLVTAASLRAAIRQDGSRDGDRNDPTSMRNISNRIRNSRNQELEEGDRRWPDSFNRWRYIHHRPNRIPI